MGVQGVVRKLKTTAWADLVRGESGKAWDGAGAPQRPRASAQPRPPSLGVSPPLLPLLFSLPSFPTPEAALPQLPVHISPTPPPPHHTHTCTHSHACVHTHVCTHSHAHMLIYTHTMYACARTHTHTDWTAA